MNFLENTGGSAGRVSLFAAASWYSLLAAVSSPIVWLLITSYSGGRLGTACASVLCILITSGVSGAVGLLGLLRSPRKRTFWVALAGSITSIALGVVAFALWKLSESWHG